MGMLRGKRRSASAARPQSISYATTGDHDANVAEITANSRRSITCTVSFIIRNVYFGIYSVFLRSANDGGSTFLPAGNGHNPCTWNLSL